ncbi:MAG TPA: polyphosphate kinase 1 [Phototrophicaceae bacterium]|nr:polyphosphate kinase 1 [Phototrophicaceae bacterium]
MSAVISDSQILPELEPETYFNRELSWLEFNHRILALAQDESLPLLERAKFLAIFSNNLDEFYMVRVASVHNKLKVGMSARPDGYPPAHLLMEIRRRVLDMTHQQRNTMRRIFAQLEEHGIRVTDVAQLEPDQREALRAYFNEEVFPVLTPLAVDHARPFPFISNLSLNLAVVLERTLGKNHHPEFVRLKVPDVLPRLVNVNKAMHSYSSAAEPAEAIFVWMEDVIADNLDLLFPGMEVVEHYPFRVTRSADIDYEYEEDDIADISSLIEESVRERRFGPIVRLSVPEHISKKSVHNLVQQLRVEPERDVYTHEGALGVSSLFELASADRPDLKYPVYVPRLPRQLSVNSDLFAVIRQQDVLLHHPYDSFKPVEDFFWLAARDPDVLAIKATLYRVGKNSPVVEALLEARDNDKQVAVLVELKARFDEENNLEWARALEHKGVHVTYGVEELPVKTHAKVSLVVRREGDGVRRYVHLGTGNYNASTARLYSDLGLLTANRELADDASRLFNRLTGYAPSTNYKRLLVAPEYLHKALLKLIDNEIEAARAGKPARLIFKMNQLEEDAMIQKLYQASQAGVQIDLLVRGLCCLRPGVPGISDNIRVISHVGRFLEHSRIYYFQNADPDQRFYLGSADLMRRNLLNRVEVVFPIFDPGLQQQILRILATYLHDNLSGWVLAPDGQYQRVQPREGERLLDCQQMFMLDSAGIDALP